MGTPPSLGYSGGLCDPTDSYDYVIITTSAGGLNDWLTSGSLLYNWTSLMNKHALEDGLNCNLILVEDIFSCSDYWNETALFNDTAAKIREFCKDAYQDWVTSYILISGDDDGDRFEDEIEKQIGSNSTKKSDVIAVNIDGITHYLIDQDADGKSDIFYNTISDDRKPLKAEKSNTYLIDINGDGKWDYTYDGTLANCESSFDIPWSYLMVTIVLVIIIVLFILFKLGIIYVYEKEYEN